MPIDGSGFRNTFSIQQLEDLKYITEIDMITFSRNITHCRKFVHDYAQANQMPYGLNHNVTLTGIDWPVIIAKTKTLVCESRKLHLFVAQWDSALCRSRSIILRHKVYNLGDSGLSNKLRKVISPKPQDA